MLMRMTFATVAAFLVMDGARSETPLSDRAGRYTLLDDQSSQLREAFNRQKGSVRLLFVVDPICPGCIHGLKVVNEALLLHPETAAVQAFVVHVPVVGAKADDIERASKLLQLSQVQHYWNASGEFGRTLGKSAGLKHGAEDVYAWDVWLLYGPDATWEGKSPPRPELLMQQLWQLEGSREFPRLDASAFAQRVRDLLKNAR